MTVYCTCRCTVVVNLTSRPNVGTLSLEVPTAVSAAAPLPGNLVLTSCQRPRRKRSVDRALSSWLPVMAAPGALRFRWRLTWGSRLCALQRHAVVDLTASASAHEATGPSLTKRQRVVDGAEDNDDVVVLE